MKHLIPLLAAVFAPAVFADTLPAASQPVNVGDAAMAASAYHDGGRYEHDLSTVLDDATAWVISQAPHHPKPAIVLDIDETSLSNWPVIRANRFAYFPDGPCDHMPKGPCGWRGWEIAGKAAAIPGTLALVRKAEAMHVAVFFITGRTEDERAATAANLTHAGYTGWAGLVLRPAGSHTLTASAYKAPARAAIEAQGYTIIANIGDQPSDLSGGHAERGFLLPNPFYRVP